MTTFNQGPDQLVHHITAPNGEHIDVSTMTMGTFDSSRAETCLFFEREHDGRMSRVVDHYDTIDEAIAGHDKWVAKVASEGVE